MTEFSLPTKIKIANGSFSELGVIAKNYGSSALLITGKSFLNETGLLAELLQDLDQNQIKATHFFDVSSNPTDDNINNAIKLAHKEECDLIIAVGGGSVIDTAKMVSVSLGNTNNAWDYFRDPTRPQKKIESKTLPLIVMPTTSGTGSVVKNKDLNIKKGVYSNFLYPDISLIDTRLLVYQTKELTAWTGCDAFGQSLESYTSSNSTVISDMFAFESIRLLLKYLPMAYQDGDRIEYREKVAIGAMLSGIAISYTETNLGHVLAEALGGEYDLHHGLTVGLFTPVSIKFNLDNSEENSQKLLLKKYNNIGSLLKMGIEHKPESLSVGEFYYNCFSEFLKKLDIPSNISQLGIQNVDIERLADLAIDMTSIESNITPVSKKNLQDIFKQMT